MSRDVKIDDIIRKAILKAARSPEDQYPSYIRTFTQSTMVKSLTKVIYKPDSQSTDEFIAIVNPEEVSRASKHRKEMIY